MSELSATVYGEEPREWSLSTFGRRIIGRLQRTPLRRYGNDLTAVWAGGWLDRSLPKFTPSANKTVVLTVAHADGCFAAARFAQKNNLPLVTIFHDWWPDIAVVHSGVRARLETQFRELYRQSAVAFCVSEGMRTELGDHADAPVLYPIPAERAGVRDAQVPRVPGNRPFRLLYSGNLTEYGPMVGRALAALKDHPTIRLEARGANPAWAEDFRQEMQTRGLWLPFAPRQELEEWLNSADAFLVPQTFERAQRRCMQTNFPSKLPEFLQYGKPVIVWGPRDGSASVWGTLSGQAMCVHDEDAASLCSALMALNGDADLYGRLVASAVIAAETTFAPTTLQQIFLDGLHRAAGCARGQC